MLGLLAVYNNIKCQVDWLLSLNKTGPESMAEVIYRGVRWENFFLSVGRSGIMMDIQKGSCQANCEFYSALSASPQTYQ